MRFAWIIVPFLTVGMAAQISKEQKKEVAHELDFAAHTLELKVKADPNYKALLDKLNADSVPFRKALEAKNGAEMAEAGKVLQADGDELENKVAADPRYSAEFKKIQDLHKQLGLPTHTDGSGHIHYGSQVQ